jgi:uncharacterized membrane protein
MLVTSKFAVFWDVTLHSLRDRYRSFVKNLSTLKMTVTHNCLPDYVVVVILYSALCFVYIDFDHL